MIIYFQAVNWDRTTKPGLCQNRKRDNSLVEAIPLTQWNKFLLEINYAWPSVHVSKHLVLLSAPKGTVFPDPFCLPFRHTIIHTWLGVKWNCRLKLAKVECVCMHVFMVLTVNLIIMKTHVTIFYSVHENIIKVTQGMPQSRSTAFPRHQKREK